MKKIVLTFGVLAGLVLAAAMGIMWSIVSRPGASLDNMEVLGYSSMVLAFLMVFFGVRRYRETSGGAITFGRAFRVGILITLIGCAFYVGTWEIIYYSTRPRFEEQYTAHMLRKKQAEGASAAELAKTRQEMAEFAEMYKNPFVNVGMTFLEVFPVGLIMTLVSAAILRRREGTLATATA